MNETTGHQQEPPPPGAAPPPGSSTGGPAAPDAGRPALRRTRSGGDRHVFGVAGGLARYFGLDPLLVRIGFVVLAISGVGAGVLLYVLAAIFVPEEGETGPTAVESDRFFDRHWRTIALVAAAFVVLALLGASAPFAWGRHDGPWGVLWVAFVVTIAVLVYREVQNQRSRGQAGAAPPTSPYEGQPAAQHTAHAAHTAHTAASWSAAAPGPGTAVGQSPGGPVGGGPAGPGPAGAVGAGPAGPPQAPPPPPPAPPQSGLGLLTAGVAAVVVALLQLLDRTGAFDVPVVVMLASALVVVGAGLVVGAFYGRAYGLIPVGLVLALVTAVAAVDPPGSWTVGDVEWRPAAVVDVQREYVWGAGNGELDLTTLEPGSDVSTSVELGMGELDVLVPAGATVHVDAHVGAGRISWPGGTAEGVNRSAVEVLRPRASDGVEPSGGVIRLDVRVGLGNVEVLRVAS